MVNLPELINQFNRSVARMTGAVKLAVSAQDDIESPVSAIARLASALRRYSIHDALDLIEGHRVIPAIVEAGGAGRLVAGDSLSDFQLAAVLKIRGDTGRAEIAARNLCGGTGGDRRRRSIWPACDGRPGSNTRDSALGSRQSPIPATNWQVY